MLPLYLRHFPPVHGLFGATLIYIYICVCDDRCMYTLICIVQGCMYV